MNFILLNYILLYYIILSIVCIDYKLVKLLWQPWNMCWTVAGYEKKHGWRIDHLWLLTSVKVEWSCNHYGFSGNSCQILLRNVSTWLVKLGLVLSPTAMMPGGTKSPGPQILWKVRWRFPVTIHFTVSWQIRQLEAEYDQEKESHEMGEVLQKKARVTWMLFFNAANPTLNINKHH